MRVEQLSREKERLNYERQLAQHRLSSMKQVTWSDMSDAMSTSSQGLCQGLNPSASAWVPAPNAAHSTPCRHSTGMVEGMADARPLPMKTASRDRRRDCRTSEMAQQIQLEIEAARAELASDPFRHVLHDGA